LVSGTAYNTFPAGNVYPNIAVSLGSGDSDTYYFSPVTGRMSTYRFDIYSSPNGTLVDQPVTGNLAWNTNGTLQSLTVSDQAAGADTNPNEFQTCSYAHDELGRLGSVTCTKEPENDTQIWGQQFNLDPFGNLAKVATVTGSTDFQANYVHGGGGSSINNQIQTVTVQGVAQPASYDLNGNLTQITLDDGQGTHNYQWDVEGKAWSIASSEGSAQVTYDALGRAVEISSSGVSSQVVYGPGGGKLALMQGQTLAEGFVGLPGGGKAVYKTNLSGSAYLAYYRHADWLGSSRVTSPATQGGAPTRTGMSYAPYGETFAGGGDQSFTGQDQDTAKGLYDFLYRRESQVQGRWLSPDPSGLNAASFADPQSWNRYAYVGNRPLTTTDPDGLGTPSGCGAGQVPGCGDSIVHSFLVFNSWGGPTQDDMPEGWCPPSELACDVPGHGYMGGLSDMGFGVEDGAWAPSSAIAADLQSGAAAPCPSCGPGQIVGADNQIYQSVWVPPTTALYWSSPDDTWGFYHQTGYWFSAAVGTAPSTGAGAAASPAAALNAPSSMPPRPSGPAQQLKALALMQEIGDAAGTVFMGASVMGAGIALPVGLGIEYPPTLLATVPAAPAFIVGGWFIMKAGVHELINIFSEPQ
jgi:RHS repeat-associated protein